jgi:RimJ/RimL family protein N-acetyltransferase
MFTPAYPVLTERLSLRPFAMTDFDAAYAIQSREDVTRYLYSSPRNRRQVREVLAQRVNQYRLDEFNHALSLAVVLRETDELIGSANLGWASQEHGQGELGYVLHPDHHGRGYATEVAKALLRLGFEGAGMHRVRGRCDGRNVASARVMAKAGMRQEAHLRENEFVKGEWTDELVFALLAKEWAQLSPETR